MELVGGFDHILDDAFAAHSRRLLREIKRKDQERPTAVLRSFWDTVIVIREQDTFCDPINLEAA